MHYPGLVIYNLLDFADSPILILHLGDWTKAPGQPCDVGRVRFFITGENILPRPCFSPTLSAHAGSQLGELEM